MTKLKRVIWCGNRFLDTYHIKTSSDKYCNIKQHGGIKNCYINNLDNHYVSKGYGVANFLLSSKMQEACVDFRDSIGLTNKFLYCYTAPSEWLHIAYIDALPNLDLSKVDKKKFKVISCDFCWPKAKIVSKESIIKNLAYCDYVFDSQTRGAFSYQAYMENKFWILHAPYGSRVWCDKGKNYQFGIIEQKYIFTVGAGDRFAAAFIDARLRDEQNITDCQEFAHETVAKWLEEINGSL